ncbi:MAG TPA: prepilin-type N-terminal cleavage/methylation domain-containing protein [Gammaproteobacteria bacterium]|nr:prepilin-type N-terminal cleavage/methylation domain-containing protein [Gammaproteobacteria bacterium]
MKAARQSGFTLIELVVVITILGILAAFAIPRFAALDAQARTAARDALAGSLRSGAALAHAMWLAQNQPPTVLMEGQTITMGTSAATPFGYPNVGTIDLTLADYSGFTHIVASALFSTASKASCTVTYAAPTAANLPPTITVSGAGTC